MPQSISEPYRKVKWQLFAINAGALLSVWAVLLVLVYYLMAQSLYQVIDDQLRTSAFHAFRTFARESQTLANPDYSQNDTFSIWRVSRPGTTWLVTYIAGNPFVDTRRLYFQTLSSPRGLSQTSVINAVQYRVFSALIHTSNGTYLIRTVKETAPTDATLDSLLWTLGIAGLFALALAITVGIWLAARSLRPMAKSWRRQRQFVADASHELRTPLAIIKTNLEVLLRNPGHSIESEIQFLGNAYSEVIQTATLIDNLLTLARADSNEQLIEKAPVDISALVEEVVDAVNPMVIEQEKTIESYMADSKCEVLGDKTRLRQLLLILIENSIRYSGKGASIRLQVESNTLDVKIRVSDTGFGIPPQLLPRIFDRFVRGDVSRDRQKPGSGLGLSIAKWIVTAHGGHIAASSTLGRGTTITVTLPS